VEVRAILRKVATRELGDSPEPMGLADERVAVPTGAAGGTAARAVAAPAVEVLEVLPARGAVESPLEARAEQTPVAAAVRLPVVMVEPERAAAVELRPAAAEAPRPVAPVELTPAALVEQTLVVVVEPTPAAAVELAAARVARVESVAAPAELAAVPAAPAEVAPQLA
jgi:hypothetical protein